MTIQEHESQVAAQMRPEVLPYVALIERLGNATSDVLDATRALPSPLPQPAMIQMLQVARLQGDLRVLAWMISHGYAMAASSHAATIFELAVRTVYLGDSDARAKEWIAHDRRDRSYPASIRMAIEDLAQRAEIAAPDFVDRMYAAYGELCWAKHGNPMLQGTYGTIRDGDANLIQAIPYYDPKTVYICRHAAMQSIRLVQWTVWWFEDLFVHAKATEVAAEELRCILVELDRQAARDGLIDEHRA